jgi:aryl-alcohol dehydrogenase-like predicted oxidoreductase
MAYRILGRTGVKVSPLCLGTMNFGGRSDAKESHSILDGYLELGGNFIDTANVYNDGKSEEVIGTWMAAKGTRDKIVLSTKVHGRVSSHINDAGNSRWHIVREVERSLKRLKTDRIDVYHIHRPDADTPIDQTLRALDDLVRAGKVLYLASSVFAGWQLAEAHFVARELQTARFDVEQPQLNIIDRRIEEEVLPFCRKYEVATICWAPLARGRLAGTYTRGGRKIPAGTWYAEKNKTDFPAAQWPIMEAVDKMADKKGISSSQLAIAWCLHVPGVTCPIIGPRTLEQMKDNMAALAVKMTAEDMREIDVLNPPGNLARDPGSGPVPR